jgi:translation initiation factor IF-1
MEFIKTIKTAGCRQKRNGEARRIYSKNRTLTEKQGEIRVEGRVSDPAPNGTWRVQLDNGHTVTARLDDKLRLNAVRIIPGDRVALTLSPFDLTRGRIVERLKQVK